jgi:hypothetical protein
MKSLSKINYYFYEEFKKINIKRTPKNLSNGVFFTNDKNKIKTCKKPIKKSLSDTSIYKNLEKDQNIRKISLEYISSYSMHKLNINYTEPIKDTRTCFEELTLSYNEEDNIINDFTNVLDIKHNNTFDGDNLENDINKSNNKSIKNLFNLFNNYDEYKSWLYTDVSNKIPTLIKKLLV